jgi:hypothetical protein
VNKQEFLDQIVFGWIKKDLENISKVRVVIPGEGNANFPLAMCIVTYIDHLGGYLLGTEKGGLEVNIRQYLSCFKTPSAYPPELLTDLFRNGLSHDYFARGGISRSNMRPPMVNVPGVGVVLDADSLLADFIISLDVFKARLSDENFMKRFAEAKEAMEERYARHKSIIDKLPTPSLPFTVYPTEAINSGASGTAVYSDINKNNT